MTKVWSLAVHGGAGPLRAADYTAAESHMRRTLEQGAGLLERGCRALDVVETMVEALESSGHHVAGRGSSPNAAGQWELDAAIMDGERRRAGAVAALRGFKSPIKAARRVMDQSPHVLLVGKGAGRFAGAQGLERVWNPARYYTPAVRIPVRAGELAHGTVGAVALDSHGDLAAAT
ncbi:MAG: isoaspartyl peptidase/L-asparaginase, partial [Pseudomonadota bacterium]